MAAAIRSDCLIVTTAVGQPGYAGIVPFISHLLKSISEQGVRGQRIIFVACENGHSMSTELGKQVRNHISRELVEYAGPILDFVSSNVCFLDSVVDRIVSEEPSIGREGRMSLDVEEYGRWAIIRPVDDAAFQTLSEVLRPSPRYKFQLVNPDDYEFLERQKAWCMNGLHLALGALAYSHLGKDAALRMRLRDVLTDPQIRFWIEQMQSEVGTLLKLNYGKRIEHVVDSYNQIVLRRIDASADTVERSLRDALSMAESFAGLPRKAEDFWSLFLEMPVASIKDGRARGQLEVFLGAYVNKLYITPVISKVVARISQPLELVLQMAEHDRSLLPLALPKVLTVVLAVIHDISKVTAVRAHRTILEAVEHGN